MAAQAQTVTHQSLVFKAKGAVADVNDYASLGKFGEPCADDEYEKAVSLIGSKLDLMGPVHALFMVNLGSNHPEILIDARGGDKTTLSRGDGELESSVPKVYVRASTIERFVDGLMDARYAQLFGHIFIVGPTRVGIKFVDALTPFPNIHPTLDRTTLDRLPKPTEDMEQVKTDLKDWGYGLVKNALTSSELQKLQTRLREQARGEVDAGVAFFDGGETKPNQRLWCLHNKGQEFIDLLDTNKVIKELVPKFLGEDAILFSYTANIARPGGSPMALHSDQLAIQPPIRSVPFGLNFMYFLTDVTPRNGGTLVMPGSHKGEFSPDDPYDTTDTVAAEGPAGTCMVFESRLWHATGPNTEPGSERPVVIAFFMRPFIRSQENFALSLHPEAERKLTDRVRGFLGFRSSGSIGGVEGKTKDGTMVSRVENPVGVLGGQSVPL